jgi:hypothetical protein
MSSATMASYIAHQEVSLPPILASFGEVVVGVEATRTRISVKDYCVVEVHMSYLLGIR